MRSDVLNTNSTNYGKQYDLLPYESITAAKTLDGDDSGKVFTLDLAAGFTVTLPAIASVPKGWYCKIVVGTNCSSNDYIITENATFDTNIIVSQINELETDTDTDGPSNTGHTTITLPNATDTVGDTFDIWSNGTNYFVQGTTKLDAGAVLA
tara:strand:+ start:377 stop:832 length:456 start_codon:yes stop_codon:yes gene_type:complete